jgi:hypothetical protein
MDFKLQEPQNILTTELSSSTTGYSFKIASAVVVIL